MVRIVGDEIAVALRSWVSEDIKESPRLSHDLGKFFFTVSIGTVGAITALIKTGGSLTVGWILGVSFGVLLMSLIVALLMVIPSRQTISVQTDLQQAYKAQVSRVVWRCRGWFGLWLIGTALGGWAIFDATGPAP